MDNILKRLQFDFTMQFKSQKFVLSNASHTYKHEQDIYYFEKEDEDCVNNYKIFRNITEFLFDNDFIMTIKEGINYLYRPDKHYDIDIHNYNFMRITGILIDVDNKVFELVDEDSYNNYHKNCNSYYCRKYNKINSICRLNEIITNLCPTKENE